MKDIHPKHKLLLQNTCDIATVPVRVVLRNTEWFCSRQLRRPPRALYFFFGLVAFFALAAAGFFALVMVFLTAAGFLTATLAFAAAGFFALGMAFVGDFLAADTFGSALVACGGAGTG
eukprot:scaffold36285_cov119-Isochrysis_galbana.AAC.11